MAPPSFVASFSCGSCEYLAWLPRSTQLLCTCAGVATCPGICRVWNSIGIELSLPAPRRGAGVFMYVPPCLNRAGGPDFL